jgi:uncharacterized membrane protein YcjF (UPF0283 family)
VDQRRLTTYLLIATAIMERDRLQRDKAMGIFGEPPRHIYKLKQRVKARDETHELRIDQAFTEYDAALDEIEQRARRDLDVHVMMQQAAMQELTNRGEDVAEQASNESLPGVDAKAEVAADKLADTFPAAAE